MYVCITYIIIQFSPLLTEIELVIFATLVKTDYPLNYDTPNVHTIDNKVLTNHI